MSKQQDVGNIRSPSGEGFEFSPVLDITCEYDQYILPAAWLKLGGHPIHGNPISQVILRANQGGCLIREVALYASIYSNQNISKNRILSQKLLMS